MKQANALHSLITGSSHLFIYSTQRPRISSKSLRLILHELLATYVRQWNKTKNKVYSNDQSISKLFIYYKNVYILIYQSWLLRYNWNFRMNEGIYVWNARGDQGYLSDGTLSGLNNPARKTQFASIIHEKRFLFLKFMKNDVAFLNWPCCRQI